MDRAARTGALSGNAAPCPGVGLLPAEDPVLGAVVTASRPLRQGYAPAGTTRRTTSTLVPQTDPSLIRFRHVISGSLALASLNHTWRESSVHLTSLIGGRLTRRRASPFLRSCFSTRATRVSAPSPHARWSARKTRRLLWMSCTIILPRSPSRTASSGRRWTNGHRTGWQGRPQHRIPHQKRIRGLLLQADRCAHCHVLRTLPAFGHSIARRSLDEVPSS